MNDTALRTARPVLIGWWFAAYAVFSVALTLGFFLEQQGSPEYSDLNSDQINILAICIRQDNPDLLRGDLIVGNPADSSFYTPLYVWLVRKLSLPDHDYLRGLNILLAITSLVYMWGWWKLLLCWCEPWMAFLLSFLARGILWPPGNEFWGIAGLWTMVPRTIFLALLPWVLWLWIAKRNTAWGRLGTAFAAGLTVNVHPISGATLVCCIVAAEAMWLWLETRSVPAIVRDSSVAGALAFAGALPFLIRYAGAVGINKVSGLDVGELDMAIRMRLSEVLVDPAAYMLSWARPELLMLVALPWAAYLLFGRKRLDAASRSLVTALAAFSAGCVLVAVLPFALEFVLRQAGYPARFAYQLVRAGKYVIAPAIVLSALLLGEAWRISRNQWPVLQRLQIPAIAVVLLATAVSRHPAFDHFPILGSDMARYLWPGRPWHGVRMENLLAWIRANTSPDTRFAGPHLIRVGALRPVVHDFASAVLLIEGNPAAYVQTARRELLLRSPENRSPEAKARLFASWGADLWVTRLQAPSLPRLFSADGWTVYELPAVRQRTEIRP
jgi:hypothetical protein